MMPRARNKFWWVALFLLAIALVLNQPARATSAPRHFSQAELDQMLAPIALYPDALLAQMLMAASYPLQVAEAARWSAANPSYSGSAAVQAVEMDPRIDWDPSVKSLVAFPQILTRMNDNLAWTERLGEAFLGQQGEVMDAIQRLRQRAMTQGNLRSDEQVMVIPQGELLAIEPVNPQVVYVPYYDPNIVYGTWWWSGYPPIYWPPAPGYVIRPTPAPRLAWSSGIVVGGGFFFSLFDWHQHQVRVLHDYREHWHERRPLPRQATPFTIWRRVPERRPPSIPQESMPPSRFVPPTRRTTPVAPATIERHDHRSQSPAVLPTPAPVAPPVMNAPLRIERLPHDPTPTRPDPGHGGTHEHRPHVDTRPPEHAGTQQERAADQAHDHDRQRTERSGRGEHGARPRMGRPPTSNQRQ